MELVGVAEPDQVRLRGELTESGAVLEAPALVARLDDVAVMRQAVEQRGGHFRVAKDRGPFAESEVGRDDDRGLLVEPADQVEEQLAAGLREGQIAELVEDDEVEPGEVVGDAALPAGAGLASSLFTRSTTLKKRPRAPFRMQARAMPTAR